MLSANTEEWLKTVVTFETPDDFDVYAFTNLMEQYIRGEVGNYSITYTHPQKGGKMCISSSRPFFKKAEQ